MPTLEKETTSNLIKQCQNGEKQAFEDLFREHDDTFERCAKMVTKNSQIADDIAQEARIKAFKSIKTYKESGEFEAWIYRITLNTYLDYKEKLSTCPLLSLEDFKQNELTESHKENVPLEHTIRKITQEESQKMIGGAMDRIFPAYKQALTMFYFSELKYSEISKILNISTGALKSRLNRSRQMLKEEIVKNHG